MDQFDEETLSLTLEYDEDMSFRLFLDEEIGNMVKRYCELNLNKDRKLLFTNADGAAINSSRILEDLRKRAKEVFNVAGFSSMATGLTGVQNLLEKGMTSAEIKKITGFGINKINDVAEYMLMTQDVEKIINKKLKK